MTTHVHPLITLFEQRAELLNVQDSKASTDDALGLLAAWIESNQRILTEDDLVVLSEIGGIFYRDGLQRRMPPGA